MLLLIYNHRAEHNFLIGDHGNLAVWVIIVRTGFVNRRCEHSNSDVGRNGMGKDWLLPGVPVSKHGWACLLHVGAHGVMSVDDETAP